MKTKTKLKRSVTALTQEIQTLMEKMDGFILSSKPKTITKKVTKIVTIGCFNWLSEIERFQKFWECYWNEIEKHSHIPFLKTGRSDDEMVIYGISEQLATILTFLLKQFNYDQKEFGRLTKEWIDGKKDTVIQNIITEITEFINPDKDKISFKADWYLFLLKNKYAGLKLLDPKSGTGGLLTRLE